ncbi:MAG: calcium/sodium antiporter [Muribaculaceae bacterium]|nr:calcium/sodium antiporter [Muribaculaceae bacterium]
MIVDIFFLLLGLALILVGANLLTDGASSLASRWGMSELMVGLTIVAVGTSAPELVISVFSAIEGNAGIAIGNVVGSNMFNVLVIIGLTAMVAPIRVTDSIMTKDVPLVVLSSAVLVVMGLSPELDNTSARVLERSYGIILLFFFLIFLRHTFSSAKAELPAPEKSEEENATVKKMPLWKAVIWVLGGFAGLIYGGDRFVTGASGIASGLGVSDAVVGLTIVAIGTSLPELATSITAAIKGKPGIALGNVIGSNIFNVFMVLGCAATIRPLPFGDVSIVDLVCMFAACVLFWVFGWFFRKRTITRVEGGILTACYLGYMIYLLTSL